MRHSIPLMIAVLLISTAAPARAGFMTALMRDMNRGYHRNHCWPQPFAYQDYQSAKAPYAIMVQHGWRQQNIISDYHYEPDSTELNEAGQRHIRSVIANSPENRRILYVQRGVTPEQTEARVRAVRASAELLAVHGQQFDVQETHAVARSASGAEIHSAITKFDENRPPVTLPAASNTFGGGGN